MKTILEIGGEGGSIKLIENNGKFHYSSNEGALLDLLNEEDQIEIQSIPEAFDTIDLAMTSLMKRYRIFRLYPLDVHADYRNQVLHYYDNYLQENGSEDNWRNNEWTEILRSS